MGKIKTTANKVRRKLKQIQGQIEEEAASANQSADFRIKKTQVYQNISKFILILYLAFHIVAYIYQSYERI